MNKVNDVIDVRPERIRPFARQPRSYFDEAALKRLEVSIKAAGQQTPGIVRPVTGDRDHEYELVDGQRRWHCCRRLRIPMRVIVRRDLEDEGEQFLASVVCNFAREDHSPMEIARAVARIRGLARIKSRPPTEQTQAVADLFGRSISWVYDYETLNRLQPKLQGLVDANRANTETGLSLRVAFQIGKLPSDQQLQVYGEISNRGLKREAAMTYVTRFIKLQGSARGRDGRRVRFQDRRTILTAIRNLFQRLAHSGIDLREAFATCDASDKRDVTEQIDTLVKHLGRLRDAVISKSLSQSDSADRFAREADHRAASAEEKGQRRGEAVKPASSQPTPQGARLRWSDRLQKMVLVSPDGTEYGAEALA